MKNEAEFCSVVKKSLVHGFKIPDPTGQFAMTIARAFDGIGAIEREDGLHFVCWEAKHIKGLSAFNFGRIETHQDMWLRRYNECVGVECYVMLGVSVSRGDNRAYIFRWDENMGTLYANKYSIHKKFLEKLPYNEIHNGTFELKNIITYDDLTKLS